MKSNQRCPTAIAAILKRVRRGFGMRPRPPNRSIRLIRKYRDAPAPLGKCTKTCRSTDPSRGETLNSQRHDFKRTRQVSAPTSPRRKPRPGREHLHARPSASVPRAASPRFDRRRSRTSPLLANQSVDAARQPSTSMPRPGAHRDSRRCRKVTTRRAGGAGRRRPIHHHHAKAQYLRTTSKTGSGSGGQCARHPNTDWTAC